MKSVEQSLTELLVVLVDRINSGKIPYLNIKSRSKKNIVKSSVDPNIWTLGDKLVKKTCSTAGGSREILKIVNVVRFILIQLRQKKTCTVRELYYRALNWPSDSQFEEVNQTNILLESLEILTAYFRQDFGVRAEQDGHINGPIEIISKTRSGQVVTDCLNGVHQAGFPLPPKISDIKISKCWAKYLLVIESGGMYQRLIEDNFHQLNSALLIHTKGQSSRATRLFIKMVSKMFNLPVFVFTDGDVWGLSIAQSIKVGAIKSCHLSQFLCTSSAIHIGLLPSQIEQYKLPTDKITPLQRQRIDDMLEDPRYVKNEQLKYELELMKNTGVKAQQQAFAMHGTDYVSKVYLPAIIGKHLKALNL